MKSPTVRYANKMVSQKLSWFVTLEALSRMRLLMTVTENKLQENLDAEIMQVILDEARESYDAQIVIELRSDDSDEIDSNVERIVEWTKNWLAQHPEGA